MANAPTPSIPSFKQPPVTEVVCGLTFKPLQSLLAPHLGLFWTEIRSEYPTCKEVEPLFPVIESFKDDEELAGEMMPMPLLPRVWFISKDQNGIIQVQRDRFLQNWRKVRDTDEYPRYGKVKEDFQNNITMFQTFLRKHELGSIQLEQLELTYINHIYQGSGWQQLGEVSRVFPDFNWRQVARFLPNPEKISWRTSFMLPDKSGRMHVTIQNAMRRNDKTPLLLFELTVRGIGQDVSIEKVWPWFDTAREWIVKGFADLTGAELHEKVWERQQ